MAYLTVSTQADIVDPGDGRLSLREAVAPLRVAADVRRKRGELDRCLQLLDLHSRTLIDIEAEPAPASERAEIKAKRNGFGHGGDSLFQGHVEAERAFEVFRVGFQGTEAVGEVDGTLDAFVEGSGDRKSVV